ncbi:nuclear transport factor 2 family protein [Luteococcus peritonei]|uniref:Nuclear transport factor 2 family protein n=1 Tax=Luteococcus peritonei TaxID=88874 RepID=A0ABW4RSR7_9ACTN
MTGLEQEGAGEQQELVELNRRIGEAESAADRDFFEALLCEQFVMQRPTGRLDDRAALLDGLATGAVRRTEQVKVQTFGERRAVVTCLVTKWQETEGGATGPGADAACFHNLRVFIRDGHAAPWRLLAWLNEPHPTR